jgi:predicted component of type VI protein secretion system
VTAKLTITEPNGRAWVLELSPGSHYSIGRAADNDIMLNDRRVSRKHARIESTPTGFKVVDGFIENGQLKRSVNHVFINGSPMLEKELKQGDRVMIGETNLTFSQAEAPSIPVADSVLRPATEPRVDPTGSGSPTPTYQAAHAAVTDTPAGVSYDDKPLGQTQLQISANEIIGGNRIFP